MGASKERRRAIMEVLCARRHETRGNLAFELGVSKRTIEYDVQSLSLEYPIYTTQGKGGGIHVVAGFELKQTERRVADRRNSVPNRPAEIFCGDDRRVKHSPSPKWEGSE